MAGDTLAEVVSIIEARKNRDLEVKSLEKKEMDNAVAAADAMHKFQDELLQRLKWMHESLFRIEKNLVRIIAISTRSQELATLAAGTEKLKDSEEPETESKEKREPIEKKEDQKGLDLVDVLAAAGITFIAFKSRIAEAVSSMLQGTIDAFVAWMKGLKPFIQKIFNGKYVKSAREAVAAFGKQIKPFFERMGKYVGALGSKIADMTRLIPGVNTISQWAARLLSVVRFLAWPITVGFSIYEAIKGATTDLEGLEEDASIFDKVVTATSGAIKGIANFLIGGILDLAKSAVSWIAGQFGLDGVETFLDSFSFEDIIGGFIDSVRDFILAQFEGISNIIKSFKNEGILGGFKEIVNQIGNNILRLFQPIVKLAVGLINRIPGISVPEGLENTVRSFGVDPKTGEDTGELDPTVTGGQGGIDVNQKIVDASGQVVESVSETSSNVVDASKTFVSKERESMQNRQRYYDSKNEYMSLVSNSNDRVEIERAGAALIEQANDPANFIPAGEVISVEKLVARNNEKLSTNAIIESRKEGESVIERGTSNNREQMTYELQRNFIERETAMAQGGSGGAVVVNSPSSSSNTINNNTTMQGGTFQVDDATDPAGVSYRSSFSGR